MTYDPLLQNIPPCVGNYIQEQAMAICKETGNVCPHWVHGDIACDLVRLDREDQGDRAERYMNQCHELEVVVKPPAVGYGDQSWFLGFKCKELLGFQRKPCNFSNKLAEDIMLGQILEMYKEFPKE